MIALRLLLSRWKLLAVLLVVASLGATTLWYRAAALSAESNVAEYRRAYELLAQAAQRQAQAISELEKKASDAAARAKRAQADAAKKAAAARRSADELAKALAGPRPVTECPTKDALEVVREDLRRALQ